MILYFFGSHISKSYIKWGAFTLDWILNELKNGRSYITAFITWLLFAFSIGIICGLCGTFFYESITFVTNLRIKYNYLLLFLPAAGLLIILLYHACKVQHDKGTNLVLDSIQAHEQIPGNMAPLIYACLLYTSPSPRDTR